MVISAGHELQITALITPVAPETYTLSIQCLTPNGSAVGAHSYRYIMTAIGMTHDCITLHYQPCKLRLPYLSNTLHPFYYFNSHDWDLKLPVLALWLTAIGLLGRGAADAHCCSMTCKVKCACGWVCLFTLMGVCAHWRLERFSSQTIWDHCEWEATKSHCTHMWKAIVYVWICVKFALKLWTSYQNSTIISTNCVNKYPQSSRA